MTRNFKPIQVRVTPSERKIFSTKAISLGLSMSEFFQRAARSYSPVADNELLEWMIEEIDKSATRASATIDEVLAFVDASNKRIESLNQNAISSGSYDFNAEF